MGNKIRSQADADYLRASLPPERIIAMLPFSEKVLERARQADGRAFGREDMIPGMEEVFEKICGGG